MFLKVFIMHLLYISLLMVFVYLEVSDRKAMFFFIVLLSIFSVVLSLLSLRAVFQNCAKPEKGVQFAFFICLSTL